MDELRFWKYHGTGNDFVLLEDLDGDAFELGEELARRLCDRRFGVGADGVIRRRAVASDADFFMDYRNADGSHGRRCAATGSGAWASSSTTAAWSTAPRSASTRVRASRRSRCTSRTAPSTRSPSGWGRRGSRAAAIPMAGDPERRSWASRSRSTGARYKATAAVDGQPAPGAVRRGGPRRRRRPSDRPAGRTRRAVPRAHERRVRRRPGRRREGPGLGAGRRRDDGVRHRRVRRGRRGERGGPGAREGARAVPRAGVLQIERLEGDEVLLTGPAVRVAEGVVDPSWLEAVAG